MAEPVEVKLFFNFRSPYCYLASKSMFSIVDEFHVTWAWRPLGGWAGRSDPERAQKKLPLTRQDVQRWCRRLGIPFNPPPKDTDPTRAGAGSLYAAERGLLRPYVVEMMRTEWAEGRNIGEVDAILAVGAKIGLDADGLAAALDDPARRARLDDIAAEAQALGVIGVPSFVIGDQIFWGNDRIDFVKDHLRSLAAARL
ncbi:MAG: 2-hydroxychromene-2-carboxylate isomerase [Alphaproteobacteria bacterium]|nr:MAG: 2-hydroxychromene-2-carboxylate isomerase [Alphaproteobacteria bacterium]